MVAFLEKAITRIGKATFVVAAQQEKVVRKLHFIGKKEGDCVEA
jgi:hypothetical protein